MENTFNDLTIPNNFFDSFYLYILHDDILNHLYNNLDKENYNILIFDLRNALKTNANEEYI
jgi:hypothetical protein